jgi:hypothetical protein
MMKLSRYNEDQMPKKIKPVKPQKSSATMDFAEEDVGGFDQVMKKLVQVPKSEVDAELRKERSRRGRKR